MTDGDEFGQLSSEFPIVLLPVRLETRFDRETSELKVRIYPDAIHADTHEPSLTEAERDAGIAYWEAGWEPAEEPDAWRALVARLAAPRAAWIAQATTPTNLDQRPAGTPEIPPVELRPNAWTRAAEARLLPDRWVILGYRGGAEVARELGEPIRRPLALTLAPGTPPDDLVDVPETGLALDSDVAWTVDFEHAEQAGMAVRIPLGAADLGSGFDRLIAIGVRSSARDDAAATGLTELLDAHHFTRGLALVPQGAATNNTGEGPAAFPPDDLDGRESFRVERGPSLVGEGTAGSVFARALGVRPRVVGHVAGADRDEQTAARAMAHALWPATWGYFLTQLMAPVFDRAAVSEIQEHFLDHVRGRGPTPAFRVGGVPYALLSATSLSRWVSRDGGDVDRHLPTVLRRLRPIWVEAAERAPRVGLSDDPDSDLLGVLGMDASTREVRIRPAVGSDLLATLFAFLEVDIAPWAQQQVRIGRGVMNLIGEPDAVPRVLRLNFSDRAPRFKHELVGRTALPEQEPLPFDYIDWIRTASTAALRRETLPPGVPRPRALLYHLLRQSALTLYSQITIDLYVRHGLAREKDRLERELLGIVPNLPEPPTVWQRFDQPLPPVSGTTPLGEFLLAQPLPAIGSFRASLAELSGLPVAELERLFTETLDCCSHRLDAWITSLASKRLQEMRAAHETGIHLGAYGWVEDLRAKPPVANGTQVLSDGREVALQASEGGYIHAPSMNHAAAGAVLHNAYLTRTGDDRRLYAFDLSSARVRVALDLLDGVREGQPLGALLGYQFERGLHEGHPGLELDKFIDRFRRLYPVVADKIEQSGEPAETIAARNVVDGVALRQAWAEGLVPFGSSGLPAGGPIRAAIEDELRKLDESLDALTDLLTAESVFQVVRGATTAAAASLDAMARGARPADPEIAATPRGGLNVTHRVMAVLNGSAPPAGNGWDAVAATPRAEAEPNLDRWVGTILGDPASVRCVVNRPAPIPEDPDRRVDEIVTLDQLGLRPLDVLAVATGPGSSELDLRLARAVVGDDVLAADARISYVRDPSWDRETVRTFPEVVEVARASAVMLSGARPLVGDDLLAPDATGLGDEPAPAEPDNTARVAVMGQQLDEARGTLTDAIAVATADPDAGAPALRAALWTASLFGVQGALPTSRPAALLEQASAVRDDLAARAARAAEASQPEDAARAVFGRDFMFLPVFRPSRPDEIEQALALGPTLTDDPSAPARWLGQAARTRQQLASWRRLWLYAQAFGVPAPSLEVAQLPAVEGARWCALPFGDGPRPAAGTVSLVMHRSVAAAPEEPWAGVLIDEWDEMIPNRAEMTGIAFRFDKPGAEAPHAVLIAVPPTAEPRWDLETVADIVSETLELARIRAVDAELLGELGQLVPSVFLTVNTADEAISTKFAELVQDEPMIVHPEG